MVEMRGEKTMEEEIGPLIPGLPDDISLICLARVPRRYHHILNCVHKRWKSMVSSEEFLSYRRKHNLQETWIYAICRDSDKRNQFFVMDPSRQPRRYWKVLQGIPPQCLRRQGMCFETLGGRLYLLGGCDWNEGVTNEVYCYDPCRNVWEEAAPLPGPRCYLISTTLNNTLYATSEKEVSSFSTLSWDTYNTISKTWASCDRHEVPAKLVKCITVDCRIYMVHEVQQCVYYITRVYDPSTNTMRPLRKKDMGLCWRGPTIVIDCTLYMVDEISGAKLLTWDDENDTWVSLGKLSPLLTRPPCKIVGVGRKIFIVGVGLSTVVVDVDVAAKSGGMLTSSSILPELDSEFVVLGCKTLAI